MCLSAPASFVASAALAAMGITLIYRTRKNKRLLPLALIPCFFAVQQAAEGIVWLYFLDQTQEGLTEGAKNLFLFFAFIFWPLWVPFSAWAAEKQEARKQAIAVCFGIGMMIAALLGFLIPHTTAVSYRSSIQYLQQLDIGSTALSSSVLFFYAVATLLPLFLSSLKKLWVIGACVALAGIVICLIDRFFFVSLWCFLAAWISLCLFFVLPKKLLR